MPGARSSADTGSPGPGCCQDLCYLDGMERRDDDHRRTVLCGTCLFFLQIKHQKQRQYLRLPEKNVERWESASGPLAGSSTFCVEIFGPGEDAIPDTPQRNGLLPDSVFSWQPHSYRSLGSLLERSPCSDDLPFTSWHLLCLPTHGRYCLFEEVRTKLRCGHS